MEIDQKEVQTAKALFHIRLLLENLLKHRAHIRGGQKRRERGRKATKLDEQIKGIHVMMKRGEWSFKIELFSCEG